MLAGTHGGARCGVIGVAPIASLSHRACATGTHAPHASLYCHCTTLDTSCRPQCVTNAAVGVWVCYGPESSPFSQRPCADIGVLGELCEAAPTAGGPTCSATAHLAQTHRVAAGVG